MKRLLTIIVFLISGCSFFDDEIPVFLNEPEPHPASSFFTLDHYRVLWLSPENMVEETVLHPGGSINLALPKELFIPIIAYPVYKEIGELELPSGYIFYKDRDESEKIKLNWETGPAAWIMIRTGENDWPLEYFNWKRMQEVMMQKCEGNVWFIDFEPLLTALNMGKFSIYDIKPQELRIIEIGPVPEGLYIPENYFSPVLYSGDEGRVEAELPDGVHRYFHQKTCGVLEIFVSDTGTFFFFRRNPD